MHKSGFVNIIGTPNVGKSTLMNALMEDRLSIITSKPQTTRHRILGIMSDEDYQIVFSDSPGLIDDPAYELQHRMNKFAYSSLEDADVILFVIDLFEQYEGDEIIISSLKKATVPILLIINKIDLEKNEEVDKLIEKWKCIIDFEKIIPISALNNEGIIPLKNKIIDLLPEGPTYFPKDQLTDKPERFFVSEMIREGILQHYKQEIPYSCEVMVEEFKEEISKSGPILRIRAVIYVDRKSQKSIIIGKGGKAIKKLGITTRESIERFFNTKVFLDLYVTVKEGWRDKDRELKNFGYND
jgi:GTP-binding protein Era